MAFELRISDLTRIAKGHSIPISVLIEVCHSCNLRCQHCCLPDHSSSGLSLAQYDTLFDQLVAAGTFFVILTGGEPFARPDFLRIIGAARRRRLCTTVFTNGTLLTETHTRQMQELSVHEVHVSLYGPSAAIHAQLTSQKGSFDRPLRR